MIELLEWQPLQIMIEANFLKWHWVIRNPSQWPCVAIETGTHISIFIHVQGMVWYLADTKLWFQWVCSVIHLCVWYDNLFFNPFVNHCHPFWASKEMLWNTSLETTERHTIYQVTSKLRVVIIEDKGCLVIYMVSHDPIQQQWRVCWFTSKVNPPWADID